MSKVSIAIGLTLKLGDANYEFIRPEIRIDEIDPEGDVEAQFKIAKAAIEKLWEPLVELTAEQVKNALDREIFDDDTLKKCKKAIISLSGRLKILEEDLQHMVKIEEKNGF
jgi:hypothetical protein